MNRRGSMLWMHWVTAFLVAASFAIAWLRDDVEDLAFRAFWIDVHRSIGFAVLLITLVRLVSRLKVGPPSSEADLPPVIWLASRVTHILIYALMIAMPLLGWAQSSARARHFNLFGVPIPALVGHDRDMAETWGWWHEQAGWVLLGLILLHALAALYHHYVRGDDVLRAMVPRRKWAADTRMPVSPRASRQGFGG